MDYELLEMMRVEELRKLLENTWLKSDRDKKVFAASENGVQFLKAAVETESHF